MATPKRGSRERPGRVTAAALAFVLVTVIPVLVALAAFAPGLGSAFTFDDREVVRDNPLLADGAPLGALVSSPYGPRNTNRTLWRPLTMLTFAIERRLFGHSALAHQVTNLFLDAAVAALVAAVALGAGLRPASAAVAGAVFGAHPLHAEAVIGIVGRSELLAATGVLLATLLAQRDFVLRGSRRTGLAASGAIFFLALLAKESAATFGLVILVVALTRGLPARRLAGPLAIHAAVLGLVLVLRRSALGAVFFDMSDYVPFLDNPLAHADLSARVVSALEGIARYGRLLVFPHPLSVDYSFDAVPVSNSPGAAALAGALVLATALGTAVFFRRRRPAPALGAGFFLATFALTSNLALPIGTIFAERLAYLPSAGFAIAAAALLPRGRVALAVAFVAIAALAIRSGTRCADFRTQRALFESAVAASPRSAKAWHNLAVELERDGDATGAEAGYAEAVAIYPAFGEANFGLGKRLLMRRDREGAEAAFRRGVEGDPDLGKNWLGLADALIEANRFGEAQDVATRARARGHGAEALQIERAIGSRR
jgi:tetratricopeptide (TPR) repeat protein